MGRVCPRISPRGHGPTTESLANSKDKPWPLCQHSVPRFSPWAVEQCWGLGRQHSNCALPHRKLHSLPQVGQDRPWGTAGCLCTARRGYASACCLRRWLYEGISRQKAEELLLQPGNRSGSFLIRESQTRQGCYSLSVRRSERASWDSVTHYRIHRLENGWVYISPGLTFPSLHDLVDHYSGNTLPLPSTLSWGGAVGGNTLRLTGREGGKVAATPHLPRCPQGWGTGQGGTLLTLPPPCPEFGEGLCCALREPCSMEGARAAPVPAMPAVVKKPSLNWDKIDSSLLFSEATAPLEEDSPISLGLREAISSYLLVTETGPCRERKE
ncbi:src-like-adapter 2 isoform X1 [Falco rusticolus]|uniref:src-like-adapter 2 isoform X1 n=1 Tax=Falco rusticolus TaxID=120794 RepID=UPI00188663F9|nr:src-like-adapter 2 isoform X1 [Falco rusticolus]